MSDADQRATEVTASGPLLLGKLPPSMRLPGLHDPSAGLRHKMLGPPQLRRPGQPSPVKGAAACPPVARIPTAPARRRAFVASGPPQRQRQMPRTTAQPRTPRRRELHLVVRDSDQFKQCRRAGSRTAGNRVRDARGVLRSGELKARLDHRPEVGIDKHHGLPTARIACTATCLQRSIRTHVASDRRLALMGRVECFLDCLGNSAS